MIKLKDNIASGLGSILEWYDFSLYGFFAPLLAQLYFPSTDKNIGIIKAFSAFAVGFLARPVGALLFGHVSDKYGRTKTLKLTPLLITIPTLLFALLPTYQHIGLLAPIAVILLRIWQGICMGGEFTGNMIYLCETARPKHLYFMGSIGSCTGSLGILVASSVAASLYASLSSHELALWGWRVAFTFSVVLGLFTYWMRRNMQETPVYQRVVSEKKVVANPVFDSWKVQWRDYLLAFGVTFLPATAFYFVFMFLPNYMSNSLNIKAAKVLGDNSISLLLRLFIIPILGLIADQIGSVRLATWAAVLFIFLSLPLFYEIVYIPKMAPYAVLLFAIMTTLNAATTPGLLIELLRPQTRSTIFSFTFNVCFGVFGGMIPMLGFLLMVVFKSKIAPSYCLIFSGIVTLSGLFLFKKVCRTSYGK